MSAVKKRSSSTGARKKKALAEVPERAPVAKKKMAAFFDPESSSGEGVLLPETEKHLERVAVKVQVSKLPLEPTAAKPVSTVGAKKKIATPPKAETSPETVGKENIKQDDKNKNNLVKGGTIMSEKEQVVQQTESGGSNLVGFVALFAAIAALGLVWFYASTSTGSPSVLNELQKSKVSLAQKIDALDAKVDAMEAKMAAAEKEKLAKSVNSSMEALDKLAATADPKTAAMLKKMKAEMGKMVTEVK